MKIKKNTGVCYQNHSPVAGPPVYASPAPSARETSLSRFSQCRETSLSRSSKTFLSMSDCFLSNSDSIILASWFVLFWSSFSACSEVPVALPRVHKKVEGHAATTGTGILPVSTGFMGNLRRSNPYSEQSVKCCSLCCISVSPKGTFDHFQSVFEEVSDGKYRYRYC